MYEDKYDEPDRWCCPDCAVPEGVMHRDDCAVMEAERVYTEACQREKTRRFAEMYGGGPRYTREEVDAALQDFRDAMKTFGY